MSPLTRKKAEHIILQCQVRIWKHDAKQKHFFFSDQSLLLTVCAPSLQPGRGRGAALRGQQALVEGEGYGRRRGRLVQLDELGVLLGGLDAGHATLDTGLQRNGISGPLNLYFSFLSPYILLLCLIFHFPHKIATFCPTHLLAHAQGLLLKNTKKRITASQLAS